MLHRIVGRLARLTALVLVAILLVVYQTRADDDDPARAPADVAPIDAALATAQRSYPGRVLKVELDREDEGPRRWVYEVKVLTSTGHVVEIELDAVSLEQLRVEGDRSRRSNND